MNCSYCGSGLKNKTFCSECGAGIPKRYSDSQKELRVEQVSNLIIDLINSLNSGEFKVSVDYSRGKAEFIYEGFTFTLWYQEKRGFRDVYSFYMDGGEHIDYIDNAIVLELWDACIYSHEFNPKEGKSLLQKLLSR